MKRDLQAALGWSLRQFVSRPTSEPPCDFAVDDEIAAASTKHLREIKSELRALQAAGVPPVTELGRPNLDHFAHKCKFDHTATDFYILKAKPSGWRFYFIVDQSNKTFIFLYVVQKKRNARNTDDYDVCCNALKKLNALRSQRIPCLAKLPDALVS